MSGFTPRDKLSKRQRAILDKQKRNTWDFSPVTRVKPSKKVYNRKRMTVIYD